MNETTRRIMQQLNTKLVQGPQGPVGPQGPKGDKGTDGTGSTGSGIVFEVLANGETVTIDTSIPVTPTAPSTPTGLAANPQSTQVSLTWSTVSGATGYKVYRGGSLVASPTSASYTDTGLTNGTQYSYTVSAVNAVGESSQSSAVTATPVAPSLPSVPTGLAATPGDTQVALTWNAVSGATSYKLYRGGSLINSPTATNYTNTGLTNDTTYSYTVSAVNGAGESAQSSAVNATPVAAAQTGKVNDASLILYQDNPVTKQTVEAADDVYFQNGDFWTAFATIKPVLNTNAATKIFSRLTPNAVNFEFTFDNHFKCTLTGKITNGTGSANFPAAIDPTANTDFSGYYHVAAVRDSTKLWLYVNNIMVHSVSVASDFWIDPSASPMKFGDNSQTNQPIFKNMGYYNRALSAAELTQNYNALK